VVDTDLEVRVHALFHEDLTTQPGANTPRKLPRGWAADVGWRHKAHPDADRLLGLGLPGLGLAYSGER
jgi:hypothetical protein